MKKKSAGLILVLVISFMTFGCGDSATQVEGPIREPAVSADQPVIDHSPGVIDHKVTSIAGETVDLNEYRGRVMLIVNTASKCGYTKQYDTLQKLYEQFGDQGLVVVGFPSNDFAGQEPGSNEEIASFCRLNYGVSFPMMAKVHTKGPEQAPIYRTLTSEGPEALRGEIAWNFTKFLIDGEGRIVARFEPSVDPMSDELVGVVRELLGETG